MIPGTSSQPGARCPVAPTGGRRPRNTERVNDHDHEPLLASCSPTIHHRFGGDHALGGQRHDVEHLRAWSQRLGRLDPTLELSVSDVWVRGLPHDTTVVVRWDAVQDMPDGSPYVDHGVHVITMRWLEVVAIDATEDSQAVERGLAVFAAHGVTEATAPAITS